MSDSARLGTQTGSALLISLVLLLVCGLMLLYTTQSSVVENQLAANETRSRQAFSAAEAGINRVVALVRTRALANSLLTHVPLEEVGSLQQDIGRSHFSTRICANDSDIAACPKAPATLSCNTPAPDSLNEVQVVSCGWSDDSTIRTGIRVLMRYTPALAFAPRAPVITRLTPGLLLAGSQAFNAYADLTVWAGGNAPSAWIGASFVRANTGDATELPGSDTNCATPPQGYRCTTRAGLPGYDVIQADPNLGGLNADSFFESIFGLKKADYRELIASLQIPPEQTTQLQGLSAQSIWINGDAHALPSIGTNAHPSLVIVDGDLFIDQTADIHGIVYVSGNLSGNAPASITGSLLVAGSSNAANLHVIFSPDVIEAVNRTGLPATIANSWKDWSD